MKIFRQLQGTGIAPFGELFQAARTNRFERLGDLNLQLAGPKRIFAAHQLGCIRRAGAQERRPASDQFIEDGAQGIDVRCRTGGALQAGLGLLAFKVLWRHVAGIAADGSFGIVSP